jgi:ABC-type multidrug transport system ATPase subunit/ABC-type multidrug transport system permease subunit
MSYAIETFNLTKRFPKPKRYRDLILHPFRREEITALQDVSIQVHKGEIFGLLGPNGAGKTTLIKVLNTLVLPTYGTALVNGYNILEAEEQVKASIGLVSSEERSFYWRLTGRQNLEFFATLQNLSSGQARKKIAEVSHLLSLENVLDQRFDSYSAGMKQRLALARGLLNDPEILFLDEPTKSLDPTAAQSFREFIKDKLRKESGKTIVLATHQLAEAEQLCDRIAILNQGRIKACGTLEELGGIVQKQHQYILKVRNLSQEALDKISGLKDVISVRNEAVAPNVVSLEILFSNDDVALPEVFETIVTTGGRIEACSSSEADLEDLFTRISETDIKDAKEETSKPTTQLKSREAEKNRKSEYRSLIRKMAALVKKDFLTEISYKLSFLLQLLGMFLYISSWYFLGKLVGIATMPSLEAYGGDYFSFVLIGVAFNRYLGVGLNSFSQSLRGEQVIGTLEAMLATQTKASVIILASSLWDFILTSFHVLIYLLIGTFLFGVNLGKANILSALIILILTILSFSGFGIISASFIMVVKRGDPINWMISNTARLLGGVYYPITILPSWLQVLSHLLPVAYSLSAMRHALLQGYSLKALALDIVGLMFFSAVMLPVSLLVFGYAVKRAKVNGSLTQY